MLRTHKLQQPGRSWPNLADFTGTAQTIPVPNFRFLFQIVLILKPLSKKASRIAEHRQTVFSPCNLTLGNDWNFSSSVPLKAEISTGQSPEHKFAAQMFKVWQSAVKTSLYWPEAVLLFLPMRWTVEMQVIFEQWKYFQWDGHWPGSRAAHLPGAMAAGESQTSHLWDPPLTHQNKSSTGLILLAWFRDYLSESDETLSPAVYHIAIGK